MSLNKSEIVSVSERYIHLKSDEVPDWVKTLVDLKGKIRENLINDNQNNVEGVTFCHPIDVPNSGNK